MHLNGNNSFDHAILYFNIHKRLPIFCVAPVVYVTLPCMSWVLTSGPPEVVEKILFCAWPPGGVEVGSASLAPGIVRSFCSPAGVTLSTVLPPEGILTEVITGLLLDGAPVNTEVTGVMLITLSDSDWLATLSVP